MKKRLFLRFTVYCSNVSLKNKQNYNWSLRTATEFSERKLFYNAGIYYKKIATESYDQLLLQEPTDWMKRSFGENVRTFASRHPQSFTEVCYLVDSVAAPIIFRSHDAIRQCFRLLPCQPFTPTEVEQIAAPIVRSYLFWEQRVELRTIPNMGCGVFAKRNL